MGEKASLPVNVRCLIQEITALKRSYVNLISIRRDVNEISSCWVCYAISGQGGGGGVR